MQKSQVGFGVKASTKISGREQTVTLIGFGMGSEREVIVQTPAGNRIYRTLRQLKVTPAATRADGIDAIEDRAHERAMSEAAKAHPMSGVRCGVLTCDENGIWRR